MKELEIKLTGAQKFNDLVFRIDDKDVKVKKNEFGNFVYKYQTENDRVNIKIFRVIDVGGALWFLTQLFFFVISIFGLFDIHRREKCLVIDYEAEVEMRVENRITLQLNNPQENAKAITPQTLLNYRETANVYYTDTKAKKIRIGLIFAKLFLALAIIATVIAVLIIKL